MICGKHIVKKWRKYSENFNSLPLEVRKSLPDLFVRWQEVTMLINEQEKILRHLKERQKDLVQHALEWYHKKGIYKEECRYEKS